MDIGKDEVVASVRVPDDHGGGRREQTRTFLSFTSELEAMAEWFAAEGVTQVVMEATGSYWKPVWYLLEERGFEFALSFPATRPGARPIGHAQHGGGTMDPDAQLLTRALLSLTLLALAACGTVTGDSDDLAPCPKIKTVKEGRHG